MSEHDPTNWRGTRVPEAVRYVLMIAITASGWFIGPAVVNKMLRDMEARVQRQMLATVAPPPAVHSEV